jgi:quercetin dioxygenase-like cupin family protein
MEKKEPCATQAEFDQRVIRYREIPQVQLLPDAKANILSSERMTAIFVTLTPNGIVPHHRHEPEQIMIIVEGEGEAIASGKRYPVKEGDVICLASNEEHGIYVSDKGMRTIEVFAPIRQD